jgi:uncharacterized coiled-coil protein SlyX
MPGDTTAALQALIKQVETLTTTVTDQQKRMDDLHSQNGRLLDQVKDNKRDLVTSSPLERLLDDEREKRDLDSKNLERGPDGRIQLQSPSGPTQHTLTREQARDPKQYHAAKDAAAAAGVELRVLRGGEDPTTRNIGQSDIVNSKVFTFDDDHEHIRWVRADMIGGNGMVGRALQAEKEGYKLRPFRIPDDLPSHAKTKFELMERAANAESDSK